jgi:hypothetical protein
MSDGIPWVGLDVHARQSTVAVFDQARSLPAEFITAMISSTVDGSGGYRSPLSRGGRPA